MKSPPRRTRTGKPASPNWGGRRPGAGRKKDPNSGAPHLRRAELRGWSVVHVTVVLVPEVALRQAALAPVLRASLDRAAVKDGFRICHFSVQGERIQLLVEARSTVDLARGVQGWTTSVARRVNAALGRRGDLFADRFRSEVLRTPRDVRDALVAVLAGARGPGDRVPRRASVDPFSSAWWFDGWADPDWRAGKKPPPGEPPVAPPRTALLKTGWRSLGLIDPGEMPASREGVARGSGG
jgi:putative transposase